MTDRDLRRRLALASVIFMSGLGVAASYSVVADVDRQRALALADASVAAVPTRRMTPSAAPPVRPVAEPRAPVTARASRATTAGPAPERASVAPPVRGLVPAAAPKRRVVVVRRTRAS